MARDMGVTDKTIRRDLETFRAAGFPLEEIVEQYGRKKWRLDPAKTQPGLSFAFDEAVALFLGRRFLDPLAGTVFWDAVQRAFRKVRAMLSAQAPEQSTSTASPPSSITRWSVPAITRRRPN
jgi:predicted DNA-binding transcriptional regulator YafY